MFGTVFGANEAGAQNEANALPFSLFLSSALVLTTALALYIRYTKKSRDGDFDLYAPKASAAPSGGPQVTVLFGTQTGTAERFANQLSEEIGERYPTVSARALDIETYDHETKLAKEELALFCVATYGDGEPTDSALSFTDWIEACVREGEKDDAYVPPLSGLKYGVFALGNTQYEHFCACGKLVDKQVKKLGGIQVVARGEGDDDANIEDDFQAWKEKLWVELDKLEGYGGHTKMNGNGHHQNSNGNGIPINKVVSVAKKAPEEYVVSEVKNSSNLFFLSSKIWSFEDASQVGPSAPIQAAVTEKRELHTKESERSCIHAEIDISEISDKVTYETGDHVGLFSTNPPELVSSALKRLSYDGKQVVKLTTKPGSKLPKAMFENKAMTIRDLFLHFLDLQSPPRKDALLALASCASDAKEKAKLEFLASKEGKEEYKQYVLGDMRSLMEVMDDFPTVMPPLGVFAARVAPKLQPRFYSISSSPLCHPKKIHVTCALVQGRSPTGREHKGVASTWLSRSKPNGKDSVAGIFVRRSNFKLPKDPSAPIIMVGPGTGFAPFRGFLQERQAKAWMGEKNLGEAHLYFGCRSKNKDFIYQDEIQKWQEDSRILTTVEFAFSRDQKAKVYVQDKLRENGKKIFDLLFQNEGKPKAHFYVCGDKEMAKDVNRTLVEIVVSESGGEADAMAAEKMIRTLQEEGRYARDVW